MSGSLQTNQKKEFVVSSEKREKSVLYLLFYFYCNLWPNKQQLPHILLTHRLKNNDDDDEENPSCRLR